jgi:hypothetical protein
LHKPSLAPPQITLGGQPSLAQECAQQTDATARDEVTVSQDLAPEQGADPTSQVQPFTCRSAGSSSSLMSRMLASA